MPMTTDISLYIQANIDTWVSPDGGTNPNGNIYELFLPDLPDRAVCVYEAPGSKSTRTLGKNFAWESPRLRIVNRAPAGTAGESGTGGWPQAQSDAMAIWNLLRTVSNQQLNGVQYIVIEDSGKPAPSGLDANNRPLYTAEFSVMKYFSS